MGESWGQGAVVQGCPRTGRSRSGRLLTPLLPARSAQAASAPPSELSSACLAASLEDSHPGKAWYVTHPLGPLLPTAGNPGLSPSAANSPPLPGGSHYPPKGPAWTKACTPSGRGHKLKRGGAHGARRPR